ncbi:TonB-dependent receptor [Acidipila sp. EB88]|uniref:TonB-dependent receptor n=1 Tax=Acidipila sp. EB88 TaxID=2305226 RepID=UPI001F2E165D|nr:TonB-dependent receptor [Acidipila sp. EB88]
MLLAQVSTTSLRGTVTDGTGAIVPGASVVLLNPGSGASTTATTDGQGRYQFAQLAPGTYMVKITAQGFAESDRKAELLVSQPATIDVALGVTASQENVNVSAEAQTLNATDASIGNAMNNQFIQAVPTEGRNVPDLLSVQPGVLYLGRNVSQDTDSRSGAVAGARSDQGNVTLDGIDDNDQVNGYAFTGVLRSTQDSTEEFRVTTANSTADQGRSSGAQVSLVTKSGTNVFHGSAYEYYRPPLTAANDWFYKQAEIENGQPNVASKLLRNTFGGTVGGPIKKDRLFFFFNYEGQRTAENLVTTQTVPTASYRAGNLVYADANGGTTTLTPNQLAALDAGCTANAVCPWGPGADPNVLSYFSQFPLNTSFNTGDGYNTGAYTFSSPAPATLNTTILKVDYAMNDRSRFFVRGNLQKDLTAGAEQFPGQPASYNIDDNTKGIAAGYSWTPTANVVNDLRYGYVRQGYGHSGVGDGNYVDFRFLTSLTAETRTTIVNVPVHNIVDNLSWSKGSHTLQFGGNWRRITNNSSTDANSFDNASSNPYWLNNEPDPSTLGAGYRLFPTASRTRSWWRMPTWWARCRS